GDLERAGAPTDRMVRAANPLRAEESVLRTAILPGLLRTAAHNRAHGNADVALFELGRVFLARDPAPVDRAPLPEEPQHLAVGIPGGVLRPPVGPARLVDVYDAVDALRAVGDALRLEPLTLDPADVPAYRRGRSALVRAGDVVVGAVGEVADDVL